MTSPTFGNDDSVPSLGEQKTVKQSNSLAEFERANNEEEEEKEEDSGKKEEISSLLGCASDEPQR